jgi:hypothetical protein
MCAFWFHYVFELDFLPSYVMRLDTDSCLTSKMEIVNPFQYMYGNKIEYMYHSTFHDFPGVIEELKDFVIQHPGHPVNNHSPLVLWPGWEECV